MQKKIIIGYSIDAVLEAISILTQSDKTEVVFYATGPLGSPLDNFNDYISNNDIMLLLQFLPKLKYSYIYNPEYIYIPYDKIKFKTSSNGFIQYPFTKTSFDDEKEWKCVSTSLKNNNINKIKNDMTLSPSKLLTAYKSKLPKWFTESIIKNLANTRWSSLQISQFTMLGLNYEFNFDLIDESEYKDIWYKPVISYNELCHSLLEKYSIKCIDKSPEEVKRIISNRNVNDASITIMDNRIDYYMNYVGGMFDRMQMVSTVVDINDVNIPQIQFDCFNNFIAYTPTLNEWAYTYFDNTIRKFNSKKVFIANDNTLSEIPLTRNNVKLYDTYKNMISLYGDKTLDLCQRIRTLIK